MTTIRFISGTVAAATLAAALAVTPASAGDRLSPGAAAAIGVVGGLAVGAAIAGAASQPVYAAPAPVYVAPSPVYVAPSPVYVAPAPVVVQRRVVVREPDCERVVTHRDNGYTVKKTVRTICD
jgi:hypothetical protein